mmetsp:Transcript_33982/g.64671  ORF Transcript_33982/g.64671 Transcript_33982/m.64671 type:complete len:201 (-) Transcript_33982:344-946(-)
MSVCNPSVAARASKNRHANSGERIPPSQLQNCASTAVVIPLAANSASTDTNPSPRFFMAPRRGARCRSNPSPCRSIIPGKMRYPLRSNTRAPSASSILPPTIPSGCCSNPSGPRTSAPFSIRSIIDSQLRFDQRNWGPRSRSISGPTNHLPARPRDRRPHPQSAATRAGWRPRRPIPDHGQRHRFPKTHAPAQSPWDCSS